MRSRGLEGRGVLRGYEGVGYSRETTEGVGGPGGVRVDVSYGPLTSLRGTLP